MDEVTRLLAELVAVPSVNPMGRGDLVGPEYGEARITAFLERWLNQQKLPFQREELAPGRTNLVIRYDAPGARRTLLWDAHQDTVPVDGMTIPPFIPHVDDQGRMYGRGSCDVKAGLAAMLVALKRLHAEKPAGAANVILVCTVDEEYTHIGASHLATQDWVKNVDLAIIAEPTMLDLVVAHKGVARWKIHTSGHACHSSTPECGENAIYRMAAVVGVLERHAHDLANQTAHPLLGHATLSIGRIEGGRSVNTVPDECVIEVDRRLLPGETVDAVRQSAWDDLQTQLGQPAWIKFGDPWITLTPLGSETTADWVGLLRDTIAAVRGQPCAVLGVPYGTDAGPLYDAKVPCVVLGPGDIAQAHTVDEWIDLQQVRQAANVYYHLACALG